MELLQLQYFRTVAYLEHMTRASQLLHVSQPSLSRTISNLEKELGAELFVRSNRKITLNENGRRFLTHVESILDELDEARSEIGSRTRQNRPIIISSAVTGAVMDTIGLYSKIVPTANIQVRIDHFRKFDGLLRNGEVDFVISDMPSGYFDSSGWTNISDEHLFIMINPEDPLSAENGIPIRRLSGRKLIIPESSAPIRVILDRYFKIYEVSPLVTYEINDVYAQLDMVTRGVGISVIPSSALYDILKKQNLTGYELIHGVRCLPVTDPELTWKLAISPLEASAREKNSETEAFYNYCVQVCLDRQEDMKTVLTQAIQG